MQYNIMYSVEEAKLDWILGSSLSPSKVVGRTGEMRCVVGLEVVAFCCMHRHKLRCTAFESE